MKRFVLTALLFGGLAAMSGPSAAADGPIGTIERGTYVCELPGNADGPRGEILADQGFVIRSASRYGSSQGGGTYLRRGDELVMTSGPRQGERYAVISTGFLRRIEGGKPGRIRCVRKSR